MKTPAQLAARLAKDWQRSATRCARLLNPDSWPISLSIGRPNATLLRTQLHSVKQHIDAWRGIDVGEIEWRAHTYRDAAEPITYPHAWRLHNAGQWIAACADQQVQREYRHYQTLLTATAPIFHRLLLRQRQAVLAHTVDELIRVCDIAMQLRPNCAAGLPLRCLTLAGNDSKFFSRHHNLLTRLLDVRYDGAVSAQGLTAFLGAAADNDHWLLLADLDGRLLPFSALRVRSSDLTPQNLGGSHLIIVENERCLHHLPPLPNAIAVLGSGLDLNWLAHPEWAARQLAYWGDIDTWGLTMLARARSAQPHLNAVMMDSDTYRTWQHAAVSEPNPAPRPEQGLSADETALYHTLRHSDKGRLEQEFIPTDHARHVLSNWRQHNNI